MACGWDVTEELLSIFQDYPDEALNTDDPGFLQIILSMRLVNAKLITLSLKMRKVMWLALKPLKVTLTMKTCLKTQSQLTLRLPD